MKMNNELSVFIARRRWLKRLTTPLLPPIANKMIFKKMNFHFDPRDMKGPSFHFAYDLERGFNNYEEESKNELLNLIPSNGIFVDIGANIGMFSVYFALKREDISLFCFEPEKSAFACLSKNMQQFSNDRVHLFHHALGNRSEEKELFRSQNNDGGHSLILDQQGLSDRGQGDVVSVKVFDDLVEDGTIMSLPDAIKVDVEGFELNVLKGMKKTIQLKKPIILIECDNKDLSQKGPFYQFFESLADEGLEVKRPGRSEILNLSQLSTIACDELERGRPLSNYFFLFSS